MKIDKRKYLKYISDSVIKPHVENMIEKISEKQDMNKYQPSKVDRPHWRDIDVEILIDHLRKEVEELDFELKQEVVNMDNVRKETADVSNLAMMIYDNLKNKGS